MKILVLSDTHGIINNVLKVLEKENNISKIIHLGDVSKDADDIGYITEKKVENVRGNCDFCSDAVDEKIVKIMGKKIFLTHGHFYNVKNEYVTIRKKAELIGVDIVLFGHSHEPYLDNEGKITLMNPGSISRPRRNKYPSYGIIELKEESKPIFSIKFLK